MKDLLFLLDPEGRIISVNPAVYNVLGYSDEDLAGKPLDSFFACPDDEKKRIANLIKSGLFKECDVNMVTRYDEIIQVNLNSSAIPGTGIVCVAHDTAPPKLSKSSLTKEKSRIETDSVSVLEESEERFRVLFEFAPDGMYISDLRGIFIDGNREAERLVGYQKAELIGKSFFSFNLLPPSQLIKAAGLITKSILGMPTGPNELTLIRKDGAYVPVEIRTFPIKLRKRTIVLGIARDLSLRKKAEEETHQLKLELHHAQKMEAISRLAGGIAHDLNNLLGGIVGYADLLRMKLAQSLPSEANTAQKIVDVSHQASRLISQLLAFAHKGKYQVQAIDLHECLEDSVQILERTIDKRITIHKRFNAASAVVMGDRTQLQNALLNLGINARDAMRSGGDLTFETGTFELSTDIARSYPYKIEPGTFVKISVIDTGNGMDAETRARAFEPFFSTKNAGKGTGLGLASVYGTVKNHNGFIELVSEKGIGTTVVICLPLSTATPAVREQVRSDQNIVASQKAVQVLVIDDEKIVRDMVSDALSALGYQVMSCASGEEAVSYYRNTHTAIDLVVLDLTMPGMGGLQCSKELRAINPRLPFVIMSGHALDSQISPLLQEGKITFLQKPFDMRTLSSTVKNALGG